MYTGGLEAAAGDPTLPTRVGGSGSSSRISTDERGKLTLDTATVRESVVRELRAGQSGELIRHNEERARSAALWQRRYTTALVIADGLGASLAAALGHATGFGLVAHPGSVSASVAAVTLPFAWFAACALNQGYQNRHVAGGSAVLTRPVRAFAQLAVAVALVGAVVTGDATRLALLALVPTLLVSLLGRTVSRAWLNGQRAAGRALTPVLAVGTAESVHQLAQAMRQDGSAGMSVVAACLPVEEFADPGLRRRLAEAGISVIGDSEDVRAGVEQSNARSVAVLAGDFAAEELRRLAWELESVEADLLVSTGLAEVCAPRVHVEHVAGTPLLRIDNPHFGGARRVVKHAFDRVAAGLGLLLLAPLLLVIGLVVRTTSRGPAFFLQTRVGRDGQTFRMVKFRSMYVDAEARLAELMDLNENDGLKFKIKNDPRVTPVGRVLRRLSLDELPQLFNIVTGAMSLVGPRPPLPLEVARYGEDTRRRLLVKPGLTGLWQVSGRSDLSWEDSIRLDLHYVENWTLALDFRVLLKTVRAVVRATGAY